MQNSQEPITSRFFKTMDRVRRAWNGVTPSAKLSKSQFFTLVVLRHGGNIEHCDIPPDAAYDPCTPMTLSALSGVMKQSMPAVSQRITRLEQMGYVKRETDQKDRRTAWIRLTPQGVSLLDQSHCEMRQRMELLAKRFGPQDIEELFRLMEKLADSLEKCAEIKLAPEASSDVSDQDR